MLIFAPRRVQIIRSQASGPSGCLLPAGLAQPDASTLARELKKWSFALPPLGSVRCRKPSSRRSLEKSSEIFGEQRVRFCDPRPQVVLQELHSWAVTKLGRLLLRRAACHFPNNMVWYCAYRRVLVYLGVNEDTSMKCLGYIYIYMCVCAHVYVSVFVWLGSLGA